MSVTKSFSQATKSRMLVLGQPRHICWYRVLPNTDRPSQTRRWSFKINSNKREKEKREGVRGPTCTVVCLRVRIVYSPSGPTNGVRLLWRQLGYILAINYKKNTLQIFHLNWGRTFWVVKCIGLEKCNGSPFALWSVIASHIGMPLIYPLRQAQSTRHALCK